MKSRTRNILLLFTMMYASQAEAICNSLPANNPDAPIAWCETWNTVSLRVGDEERQYSRSAFAAGWKQLVVDWLASEDLDPQFVDGARVNYWLSVPEANPTAAQVRVEVVPQHGQRFLLSGSPFLEDWVTPTRDHIAVLRNGSYPDDFGIKAGVLLIKGTADALPEDIAQFLAVFSVGTPKEAGGKWFEVPTVPLGEGLVAHSMRDEPKFYDYVDAIYYNSLYEWIAWRERAFVFTW